MDQEGLVSVEDKLWTESTRRINGHYQLPIPFRQRDPGLADNRQLAMRRLMNLRKRLERDRELLERYGDEIQKLLDNGYAERGPLHEIRNNQGKTWYLPHHAVLNPNKPGKVRIVFDCAAAYGSMSLNSQVMQGPDLNNQLLGVLMRFRQREVALMADIETMFHQVRVTPNDRDALRSHTFWNYQHIPYDGASIWRGKEPISSENLSRFWKNLSPEDSGS